MINVQELPGTSVPHGRRFAVAAIALYVCAWIASWLASASHIQAPIRLALAVSVVVLLPGHAIMRALGWFSAARSFRERLPLAFGVGYAAITVLCAVSAVIHLSLTQAFAVLSISTIGAAIAPPWTARTKVRTGDTISVALLLAVAVVVTCGWILEPTLTGEETVELISIRKIVESPFISIDGIMPEPKAIPTYVITPYYLFVALVAKAAGVSMFVAYLKLRALYAGLALVTFAALGGRLFQELSPRLSDTIALGLVALFVADPDPWTWPASLLPLVRRGGVTAGVLAPVFMLAMLVFVTRPRSDRSAAAEWIAPGLMLLSVLTTHAMEIIYAAFFVVAVAIGRLLVSRPRVSWRRIAAFGISAAVAALAFRSVHARLAGHVFAFDQRAEMQVLLNLKEELAQGVASLWGISDAGRYLVSVSGRVVPYTILGILLTPILVWGEPLGGIVIWAAVLLPLTVYCSSKLFILLQLATSTEVLFVFSYFTLVGTIAFLAVTFIGVNSALKGPLQRFAHPIGLRHFALIGVAAAALGWIVATLLLRPATSFLAAHPLVLPWVTAMFGAAALTLRRFERFALTISTARSSFTRVWRLPDTPWVQQPRAGATVVLVAFVTAVGFGFRGFEGELADSRRESLMYKIIGEWSRPSVLDWNAYYPVLQRSTGPTIDLPMRIVDDLRQLLPPLQTLIADPAHSFALPVVMNQHIVNPGHVISTSLDYFNRYTRLDASGNRIHPIFNDSGMLSDEERRFLNEYGVQYILVNPRFHDVVRRKLSADPGSFELVYEHDQFLLYRCSTAHSRKDGHG
jgi:hypothetical protein